MDCEIEYAPRAIDEVTSSPGLWVEAPLSQSQIPYLNNHELGHCRSDFIDHDDETKKTPCIQIVAQNRRQPDI